MLSYRHAYHAGNFADVHKHCLLIQILQQLLHKPAPLAYYETHAGRGRYDLDSEAARINREYADGIQRIQASTDRPALIDDYLRLVDAAGGGQSAHYPGSPLLARELLRQQDQAILMELHSSEAPDLKRLFRDDRRIAVHHRDGYEGLLALLPPPARRGLVLIDPSYETKLEYRDLPARLERAYQRWPGGTYMIWYPLLSANRHQHLRDALLAGGIRNILDTEIAIGAPQEHGLYGCGALIVNPPWQLETAWSASNQWLADRLQNGRNHARTHWLVPE